ncbi:MAG: lysophospholipid acyltransferase family protein [Deltaproteobacteria bacterium]|nr:lysophospholipid acyltransferase family protein [Deltaproteobacteria bacterium]
MAAEDSPASPASTEGAAAQPLSASGSQVRKKKAIRPAREKSRAVARLEYLLFLAFFFLFRLLPFRLAFRVGEGVGWLLYLLDQPHRQVGLRNLELAFPNKSAAERQAILRESLLNLGRLAAEFCHLHALTKKNISERVRLADLGQWQDFVAKFQHTGALILTGHFGNWELLAHAHACYGFPVHIIHRRLRNPLIDDLIVRERERCGNKVIRKTTAGLEVFRAIRQKAVVVAAVDQNTSGRMGVFVPFFSRLASTSTGLAGLALASGIPVIPAFLVREGRTWRHRIELLPPIDPVRTGDQEADLRATTARFTAVFQQMVERHPDHWLWIHKRWKRRPEGEAPIY